MENKTPALSMRYLNGLAFTSGMVTLASELSASRLLAPFFGSSLVVWTSLIGLILLALAGGAALGGRVADKHPGPVALLWWNTFAVATLGLTPLVAKPILGIAQRALGGEMVGLLLGTFAGTVLLLGVPMILLGGVVPWIVRLAAVDIKGLGALAGRLSACATLGSFIGTFLPVLLLIPMLGTRRTFFVLAAILGLFVFWGFVRLGERRGMGVAGALVAGLLIGVALPPPPIKSGDIVVDQRESPYQYLVVEEGKDGWRRLRINEGVVSHSKVHAGFPLTYGAWDYVALAPFVQPEGEGPIAGPRRWAVLGAGAGTTARLVRTLYPGDKVLGVELDPVILELGEQWFDSAHPDYETVAMDARGWMRSAAEGPFDVVVIDAYRQPYIPFELTTVECFREVERLLAPGGVVAINVASPRSDRALINVLAASARTVFPGQLSVTLRRPSQAAILFLSREAITAKATEENLSEEEGMIRALHILVRGRFEETFGEAMAYTDDHAPVERLMDLMVLKEIRRIAGNE